MRRSPTVLLLALVVLPMCAPSPSPGDSSTTGGGTGDATTGETPTTGAAASTSTGELMPDTTGPATMSGATTLEATTGEATTGEVTTGEATTGEAATTDASETTGASTGETDSTGASESTGGSEPVTKAWRVDGQELQVRVMQADIDAGLCRGVLLGPNQGLMKYAAVDAPRPWGVIYVFVHQNLEDCFDPYTWYENENSQPVSATGTVVFHDDWPNSIDVDVTGAYGPGPDWTPAVDTLIAVDVPVVVG